MKSTVFSQKQVDKLLEDYDIPADEVQFVVEWGEDTEVPLEQAAEECEFHKKKSGDEE